MIKNRLMRQYARFGVALGVVGLLVSCTAIKPLTAEESVRIRASERWQALIEGKLDKAYDYEVPEYRKVFSFEQYKREMNGVGLWKKAEVKDVACKDECVVTMQIHVTIHAARLGGAMDTSSLLKEQWMRDTGSGEWFHLSSK